MFPFKHFKVVFTGEMILVCANNLTSISHKLNANTVIVILGASGNLATKKLVRRFI